MYSIVFIRNNFSLANHFGRRTMHATGRKKKMKKKVQFGEREGEKEWVVMIVGEKWMIREIFLKNSETMEGG